MMSVARLKAQSTPMRNNTTLHEICVGMVVRCQNGAIGRVAGLAPAWAEHPTHLVVRSGPLVPHEWAIPLHWVVQVADDQVLLRVRRRHVTHMSPLITDDLLQAELREALHNEPALRADDAFQSITVAVHNHVVTLRGHVRTIWLALLAEAIARQLRGVWNVQNELISDNELEDAVMQALRGEYRLHMRTIYVQSMLGQVTLRGQVRTVEETTLAVLLARRVLGVRAINNELVVIETSNPAPALLIDAHTRLAARRTVRARAG